MTMTKDTGPAKAGRPTKFKPEFIEQAHKLALLGATDAEMADFFEVHTDTLNEWKLVHPEFSVSLREGKIKADTEVAAKLYAKCMGAEWVEDFATKVKKTKYENGKKVYEEEEIQVVPVRKGSAPDTAAISLWLRNRQGANWRETIHTNVTSVPLPEQDKTLLEEYAKGE